MRPRTYDGEPVFPRPAVGALIDVACTCGVSFTGRVDHVVGYGDPVDLAFVTHRDGCGTTRCLQVERAPDDPAATEADEWHDELVAGVLAEEQGPDLELAELAS